MIPKEKKRKKSTLAHHIDGLHGQHFGFRSLATSLNLFNGSIFFNAAGSISQTFGDKKT